VSGSENTGDINDILGELRSAGIIKIERSVRPYTVFRLWNCPEEMSERLYGKR
jgi:hypothetical protein